MARVKARWKELFAGDATGEPAVLSEGMEATSLNMAKAVDLQLEEMSSLGVREISRILGVPGHLLGEQGSINFSTAVESQRSFVSMSLKPWAVRFGSCLSHSLLSRDARLAGERVALDLSSMVRGEGQELSEFLSRLTNGGILSVNEARQSVGYGPITGGDVARSPVNTMPIENWLEYDPGNKDQPDPTPEPEPAKAAPIWLQKVITGGRS